MSVGLTTSSALILHLYSCCGRLKHGLWLKKKIYMHWSWFSQDVFRTLYRKPKAFLWLLYKVHFSLRVMFRTLTIFLKLFAISVPPEPERMKESRSVQKSIFLIQFTISEWRIMTQVLFRRYMYAAEIPTIESHFHHFFLLIQGIFTKFEINSYFLHFWLNLFLQLNFVNNMGKHKEGKIFRRKNSIGARSCRKTAATDLAQEMYSILYWINWLMNA